MKEYLINGKTYRLNVFERLETKEQAYFLGYLAGDGGFMDKTHKRLARLYVSSNDNDIISYFQKEYSPDANVTVKLPVNNTTRYNIVTNNLSYSICFSSKFYECFNKFGVLALKKDRKLVNVSKQMMKSYIHGLFDADGHVSYGLRKDRNRFWCNFGITHQSFDILTKIQNYIDEELSISSSVRSRKDENCMDLKFSKPSSVIKIMNWLYDDPPAVYSKKKLDQYKKLLSLYNS